MILKPYGNLGATYCGDTGRPPDKDLQKFDQAMNFLRSQAAPRRCFHLLGQPFEALPSPRRFAHRESSETSQVN